MQNFRNAFNKAGSPTPAARGNQQDNFHGTIIHDPYRQFEDTYDPDTEKWVAAEQERFERYIDDYDGREDARDTMLETMDYAKSSMPTRYGSKYIDSYNSGLQKHSVYRIRDSLDGEPRVFFDPNALEDFEKKAVTGFSVSPNGKYVAYRVSESGSDAQTMYIHDIDAGEDLPTVFQGCRFTSVVWDRHSDDGFSYTYPSETDSRSFVIKHHNIGDDVENDNVIFAREGIEDYFPGMSRPHHGTHEWVYTSIGTSNKSGISVREIGTDEPFKEVFKDAETTYGIFGEVDGYVYMQTTHNAPQGKVVKFKLDQPEPENWHTVIPENPTDKLEFAMMLQGKLYVNHSHDCADRFVVCDLDGNEEHEISIPPQSVFTMGSVDHHSDHFLLKISNFQTAGDVYKYDLNTRALTLHSESLCPVDLKDCIVERLFATSKDGTQVPMTVIRHPDTELDGTAAVKLYGYGGFNNALGPGFSFGVHDWVRSGGIYVQANLRGGGEFGDDWYKGGILENKQNVFDDFAACQHELINRNYTDSGRLVIEGGSNGGLLTLVSAIQNPRLQGAVISAVPVTDVLRFMEFTYGSAWKSDYGDPKTSKKDFETAVKYSPVHNVVSDQRYSPILVTTSDHDDRVVPGHSFKMVAELHHTASRDGIVLMRVAKDKGHGGAGAAVEWVETYLDDKAFVEHTIGPLDQAEYVKLVQSGVTFGNTDPSPTMPLPVIDPRYGDLSGGRPPGLR